MKSIPAPPFLPDTPILKRLAAWFGWSLALPGVIRNCRWFGNVESTFPTRSREVLLSIDDGPNPLHTPQMLDVLAREGVRAMFFVIGKNVDAHPELCRRMVNEGHSVQNHTYSHPSGLFWAIGPKRAAWEIDECSRAITEATSIIPTRFRAPVGMANPHVHLVAAARNLKLTGWSASGHDGIAHNPDRAVRRIRQHARPGCIVLIHESHLRGMNRGERACTLSKLLNTLKNDGYTFRTSLENDMA